MSSAPNTVHRSGGAVAAGHADVAAVGADILERGGNAVDAVVAMVAAGCVCEPTLTSFGGGGFLIAGGAGIDEPVLLDFFARQPGLERRRQLAPWEVHELVFDGIVLRYGTGPASVAVPGISRGIAHASRRFGRLPLRTALEPSIRLAADGVVLTRTQAGEHLTNASLVCRDPDGEAIWLVDGEPRGEGAVFRQPWLAETIERIAATDGEALHVGELAESFLRWSDTRRARISRADLAGFQVIERRPLSVRIGPLTTYANPEPSMGGAIVARLLEAIFAELGDGSPSGAARDLAVGRVIARVLADVASPQTRAPGPGEAVVVDTIDDDGSRAMHDAVEEAMHDRGGLDPDAPHRFARSPNTTHVSAIDADGMVCGATTTVGYGAGEFIPGTGVQLNNMLAEYDHTARRPAGVTIPSMMTPSIVVGPRSIVQMGSAGSDRIPTAIAQVVERMLGAMTIDEAIDAPRFAWDGALLHAEPGIDESALEQLDAGGAVVRWAVRDAYFGTTNGTATGEAGFRAAGDPRREAIGLVL